MKTIAILICLGLFVSSSTAIEFSNPIRSVSASNNKGSSDSKSTSDFGPFNASARVDWAENWETDNGPYLGQYYSSGQQSSTITYDGIIASGESEGLGSFEFWGYEPLHQYSSSSFQVDFEIDVPREVTLTGILELVADPAGYNFTTPEAWVTLSGQTGEIFSQEMLFWDVYNGNAWYQEQINETFFLDTGLYTLSAGATTDGWFSRNDYTPGVGGGGWADYDITMTPEPATLMLLTFGGLLLRKRKA